MGIENDVITLLVAVLAFTLGYLFAKRGPKAWQNAFDATAKAAVRFAEVRVAGTNEQRLTYAVDYVIKAMEKHGVKANRELVTAMVEKAYQEFKVEMLTPNEEPKP